VTSDQTTAELPFSLGDLVQLKSGGPPMSVCDLDLQRGVVGCAWFDRVDGEMRLQRFTGPSAVFNQYVPSFAEMVGPNSALIEIAAERQRQMSEEGFSRARDDEYTDGQLAQAASSYALMAAGRPGTARQTWPVSWGEAWLKSSEPRRDLIKAGALIAAEIERRDRAITAQGDQP